MFIHQHPVRRADGHPGQHHRRRLVIGGERPGRLPEQVLHQGRRDRQPVCDHLPCRDMPFQGEGDVREQPRQPGQRLAMRRLRHQPRREHQPDDQRVGHDPPPLPRLQPALLHSRGDGRLDRPVAEIAVQLTEPDQARKPRASIVPLRRTTAGAVTTGRQNSASSPADGTCPSAVTVSP
jgi:hypothetical protein